MVRRLSEGLDDVGGVSRRRFVSFLTRVCPQGVEYHRDAFDFTLCWSENGVSTVGVISGNEVTAAAF